MSQLVYLERLLFDHTVVVDGDVPVDLEKSGSCSDPIVQPRSIWNLWVPQGLMGDDVS